MAKKDLSMWREGPCLPEYDDWVILINHLEMTLPEIEGWINSCKKEAWVHEKLARLEDQERNTAVARYFWERTNLLIEYKKRLEKSLDQEVEDAKNAKKRTELVLAAIGDKTKKRDDIVPYYASLLILPSNIEVDWLFIHNAIMMRWSLSAISYIKSKAWKLVPDKTL